MKFKNRIEESDEDFKNRIKSKSNIDFTNSQYNVLKRLLSWIKTSDRVFTLSGSAGTGKTTITKIFIDLCNIPKRKISVSAPTHKAKKIISNSTELKGETLQSLLGLRPNTELVNFDINNPQFDILSQEKIDKYELIIIDECSMINKSLFEHLIEKAGEFNVKILFIGDHMQLPPIKEVLSSTFKLQGENIGKLIEIVRQADDNPLLDLLTVLRKDIQRGSNHFHYILKNSQNRLNSRDEGFVILRDKENFKNYLLDIFKSNEFKTNKEFVKYGAWTNVNIGAWNKFIRQQVHNEPDEKIVEGDLLMSYKTVTDRFLQSIITNSEEYIVTKVIDSVSSRFLNCYKTTIQGIHGGIARDIYIVKPEAYKEFIEIHNNLLETAITYRRHHWQKYYNFKSDHLLLETFKDKKGNIIVKKDLDYGYGCTIHKTQGSTYDNIVINGIDLNKNSNKLELKKLWYVALSRASKKCIIRL